MRAEVWNPSLIVGYLMTDRRCQLRSFIHPDCSTHLPADPCVRHPSCRCLHVSLLTCLPNARNMIPLLPPLPVSLFQELVSLDAGNWTVTANSSQSMILLCQNPQIRLQLSQLPNQNDLAKNKRTTHHRHRPSPPAIPPLYLLSPPRRVASLVGAEPHQRVFRLAADSSQRQRSPGVPYTEAVEVGLCFGWIDSQMAKGAGRRMEEAVIHAAHKQKQLVGVEQGASPAAHRKRGDAAGRNETSRRGEGGWAMGLVDRLSTP